MITLSTSEEKLALEILRRDGKVRAVQHVRTVTGGLGLKECKEYVEALDKYQAPAGEVYGVELYLNREYRLADEDWEIRQGVIGYIRTLQSEVKKLTTDAEIARMAADHHRSILKQADSYIARMEKTAGVWKS